METQEADIHTEDIVSMLLTGIAYLISPILLIWSLNTLFGLNIAFGFKTWLAGFVLVILFRFHLRGSNSTEIYYESDDEDGAEDGENAEIPPKSKGKLIPYQEHRNKKKPPDGP